MNTILVLTSHPDFAEAVRSALKSEPFHVIHRIALDESEPFLSRDLITACILDADLLGVESVWIIERIHRQNAKVPIIAYASNMQSDWEEEAFLRGVTHVLSKPVREKTLKAVLERLTKPSPSMVPGGIKTPGGSIYSPPRPPRTDHGHGGNQRSTNTLHTLDVLRDFSNILTYSLDSEAMLKQFLVFLRQILGISRAVIFLNRPATAITEISSKESTRRLRSAAAIGMASGLLEHFELSLDSGIGAQVSRLGRILRRDSEEAHQVSEVIKEFELLGAEVAVPIFSRDAIIGVAVFDGRVTGEPLVNEELGLIYHLLEQVGLALRNIWLHDQLSGNNEMMTDVLRELSSACVVVGYDLKVLHANKSAKRHFGRKNERTGGLEFSDLPQFLGAKIFQVLRTGSALEPFRYEPENSPGTVYMVSVVPFQRGNSAAPSSALLTAEDLSQSEQLRKLEVEAANLRLIRNMADRMAHEIGNAMVPLSTHQQLLFEKFNDPEFRESLDHAMGEGIRRVSRLINQMRFLARDGFVEHEQFPVDKMIEEAYQEAVQQQTGEGAQFKMDPTGKPVILSGDRAALKHALSEIMLNALQASPKGAKIGVRFQTEGSPGDRALTIEVQDNGSGFSPEAAKRVPSPFYTTRTVGLGLGLAVSQKIIENHHGRLEIVPSPSGLVRVSLPLEPIANGHV